MFLSLPSSGVGSLVQLKSRELLVGSGSGTLSLVRDSSAEMTRQRKRGVKTDGAPRVVAEPTKSCLNEVRIFVMSYKVEKLKRIAGPAVFADQVDESTARRGSNNFAHSAGPGNSACGHGLRPDFSDGHADFRHRASLHLPHELHLGYCVSQVCLKIGGYMSFYRISLHSITFV